MQHGLDHFIERRGSYFKAQAVVALITTVSRSYQFSATSVGRWNETIEVVAHSGLTAVSIDE